VRIELIELPHLPIATPTQVAAPCVSQIRISDRPKPALRAKPCSAFVGQVLILNEIVLARQPDGLFVEVYRVELPAFEARNLGAHQCRAVCERRRAVLWPDRQLLVVSQRFQMPGALLGRGQIAIRRPG
jgi:hypothetical protein